MAKPEALCEEDMNNGKSDDSDYDSDRLLDLDKVRSKQFMCGVVEGKLNSNMQAFAE